MSLRGSKTIICADSLPWMRERAERGAVVTSLPDADEIGVGLNEWAIWFVDAARLCMELAPPECAAVFYQTDRKAEGRWWSKAGLLMRAAESLKIGLLWHKIALRRPLGSADLRRPTFTHLMAFSARGGPGKATADVFERGPVAYPNGMGLKAARVAVDFAGANSKTIIDPFCGRGTVPAVAEALGYRAIGVDIDDAQCAAARTLRIERG